MSSQAEGKKRQREREALACARRQIDDWENWWAFERGTVHLPTQRERACGLSRGNGLSACTHATTPTNIYRERYANFLRGVCYSKKFAVTTSVWLCGVFSEVLEKRSME